jgi:hypothetical protein
MHWKNQEMANPGGFNHYHILHHQPISCQPCQLKQQISQQTYLLQAYQTPPKSSPSMVQHLMNFSMNSQTSSQANVG